MVLGRRRAELVVVALLAMCLLAYGVPRAIAAVRNDPGPNANVHVTKTVTAASLKPVMTAAFAVDRSSALPGDRLVYTATVTNVGSTLTISGRLTAQATDATDATVASYDDVVWTGACPSGRCDDHHSNHGHDVSRWDPLAGHAANVAGYSPVNAPASSNGLDLQVTPVAADGVTYPLIGDLIAGTVIGKGRTATWDYTATVALTPELAQRFADPSKVGEIRNTFRAEVTPRKVNAAQPPTVNTEFGETLFSAGQHDIGAITNAKVDVTLPDGSHTLLDASTVPAFAALAPGSTATATTTYTVPVPAPKGDGESDQSYLARLTAADGSALNASAAASGTSLGGHVTATPASVAVSTTEHMPILGIIKSGPATANAGDTVTYQLSLANTGSADATNLGVTDEVPAGSPAIVTGAPAALAAGGSGAAQATYVVPSSQPSGALTDTAEVAWHDANANAYGPVSSHATTQITAVARLAHVVLSPANAGPNERGGSQTLTATVTDQSDHPVPGQTVTLTITGANPNTASAVTDATGTASFTYDGARAGTDTAQASVLAGSTTLQSNTSTILWVATPTRTTVGAVTGNFFAAEASTTTFQATTASTPAFSQQFPTINFNPPSGLVAHDIFPATPDTRPFTDITTDAVGNATGMSVAQGNGHKAGLGDLATFDASLSTTFQVPAAGDVTFEVIADDGFVLGVGGGATRISGDLINAPAATAFASLPVMESFNALGGINPAHVFTVHFPAAGAYPVEIDYFDRGGQLSLVLTTAPVDGAHTEVTIPANADIFGAGHTVAPSPSGDFYPPGPALPVDPGFALPAGGTITFPGTSGDTTAYGGCGGPHSSADGVNYQNTDIASWNGIAGIVDPSRQQFLTGVFLDDTEPAGNPPDTSAPPAPDRLQYTDVVPTPAGYLSHDLATYEPQLRQVFFIGDGHTASGELQSFRVPSGATRLFLGMADGFGFHGYPGAYGDNCGHFTVNAQNGTPSVIPPASTLALSPQSVPHAVTGLTQPLTVTTMGPDGQPLVNLPVDVTVGFGTSAPLHLTGTTSSQGLVTVDFTPLQAGDYFAQASADYLGAPLYSNAVIVTADNPPPPGGTGPGLPAPAVTAASPADGSRVTRPTPISATITPPPGETIASWRVTYQALDPEPEVTLASGTGQPPATLATLDTTLLANDTYAVHIVVEASGGGVQDYVITLAVDGNLKLGRYQASFQDLDLPVADLPMQVVRTYDSFDTRVGDFGVGWHVGLSNFRISTNRVLGAGGWSQRAVSCGLFCTMGWSSSVPHFVTVVFPDQHSEIFDFTPIAGSEVFWDGQPAFTPRSATGVTSTLEPLDQTDISYTGDGNLYAGNPGPLYNPQRFKLTTKDGRVYILHVGSGLESAADSSGNTVTVDANGVHSSTGPGILFTRDGQGRIAHIDGPTGQQLDYGYSASGDLTSVTDATRALTTFSYDGAHHLTNVTGATPARVVQYAADGRVEAITDGAGNTVHFGSDVAAQQTVVTSPDQQLTTVYSYDDLGDVVREDLVVAGSGRTVSSTYTYDSQGHQLSSRDPDGHTTSSTWDGEGNLVHTQDQSGVTTDVTYNEFGKPVQVLVAGALAESNAYDDRGRLIETVLPQGSSVRYERDVRGRVVRFVDPQGRSQTYTYDANGYVSTLTTPTGVISRTNDASGNIVTSIDQRNDVSSYTYDADGRVTSATDGNLHTQRWEYNQYGSLGAYVDKAGHTTSYTYDTAARLHQKTDRNGASTTYTYDQNSRLSSVSIPGETISIVTDPLGRPTSVTNAAESVSLAWDDASLLVGQSTSPVNGSGQPSTTLSFTKDGLGRPQSVSGPTTNTTYVYDGAGRLNQVTDTRAGQFTFGYDAFGRLVSEVRPNGTVDSLGYNSADELTSRHTTRGGALIARSDYSYNGAGLRDSFTDLDGQHLYTYDPIGQLASATHPAASGLTDETFEYDGAGNRSAWAGNPSSEVSYDGADHLLGDAHFTYGYDAEGNLRSKTDRSTNAVEQYDWNASHQLLAIHHADQSVTTFTYDGLGRRIEVNDRGHVTRFVFDGTNIRAVLDGANQVLESYVTGPGYDAVLAEVTPSAVAYPIPDALGTIRTITDASGDVTTTRRYDSFGTPSAPAITPRPFSFTGLVEDPSGLLYARARYLDTSTGRFLSEDSHDAANLYPYSFNNPISYRDPTGRTAGPEEDETLIPQTESEEAEECAGEATESEIAEGAFSIIDWTGYPDFAPKPPGPFTLLEGDAYDSARRAANKANAKIRRKSGLRGCGRCIQVHELNPVKFGGSPTDLANKYLVSDTQHTELTNWWNALRDKLQDLC